MMEIQERKIEINVHEGGQANIALENAHIGAHQNNSRDINKDTIDKANNSHYLVKKMIARTMIVIVVLAGIGSVLCTSILGLLANNPFQIVSKQTDDDKSASGFDALQEDEGDELYSNSLYLKAKALQIEGEYLDAAVVYNELYGSLPKAKDYQLEIIKFWEAFAYYNQFMHSEGAENKYRYKAIEIFEKIANTKNEENEDIRLMSLGCLLLLGNNLGDVDYEKKWKIIAIL